MRAQPVWNIWRQPDGIACRHNPSGICRIDRQQTLCRTEQLATSMMMKGGHPHLTGVVPYSQQKRTTRVRRLGWWNHGIEHEWR